MGKIIIRADDSFEAVAARAPNSTHEHKQHVTNLTKDLKIAKDIKKQRTAEEKARDTLAKLKHAPKVAGNIAKRDKAKQAVADAKEQVRALKGKLSNQRHTDPDEVAQKLAHAKEAQKEHSTTVRTASKEHAAGRDVMRKDVLKNKDASIRTLQKHITSLERANEAGKGDEDDLIHRIRSAKRDVRKLEAGKAPDLVYSGHLFEKKKATKATPAAPSADYDRERKELMTRFNQIGRAVEAAKRKVANARTTESKNMAAKELKALEKSYNSTRIALTKMKPSAAQRAKDEAANERSKKAATRVHRKQVDSDKRKAAEYGRDVKLGLRDSR